MVLKNDKNEVFKAVADASKACDFILDKNRSGETPAEEGPCAAAITESRQPSAARSDASPPIAYPTPK